MKGKFMIIAALLGALTFGACVDSEESASVTAVRNAKAEQLKSVAALNNAKAQAETTIAAAQAALLQAEAQKAAAEAAAQNASTEAQKIANQIAAAQAAADIARIEAELECAKIKYQQDLLQAKLDFNEALKGMADEQATALKTAYDAYNTSLTALATAQDNLAAKKKAIADEQAKLAKVDTAEEAIAAVNKSIADQTSKVNKAEAAVAATKAAIAKLEVISHSSDQLKNVEIPAAEKALETAIANYYSAYGATALAYTNLQEYDANMVEEDYFLIKNSYPWTLDGTDVDVIDAYEDEVGNNKDSWAFYLTELNDKGVYKQGTDEETAVVLFDNEVNVQVYDDENNPIYEQRVLYNGIHADAVKVYEAELAKLLSTSDEAIELAEAKAHLEARTEVEQYEDLQTLYDNYIEDVADVNADIAEKQAEIKSLTYKMDILKAANYDQYYKEDIEDIKEDIEALEEDIEDLEADLEDLEEAFEEDLEEFNRTSVSNAEAGLNAYKNATDKVIAAQKAYDFKAALYAEEVEYLNLLVSLADAWTATYVTAFNAAVVDTYEAQEAYIAAATAKAEAEAELKALEDLWDELAAAPAGSVKDDVMKMLNDLYATLATQTAKVTAEKATLKGYTDTLAALQNEDADKAAAALAKYVETMTKNIANWEAELPDLELKVAMAEVNVASYKAALDALLAE